jgi:hypothetical protein
MADLVTGLETDVRSENAIGAKNTAATSDLDVSCSAVAEVTGVVTIRRLLINGKWREILQHIILKRINGIVNHVRVLTAEYNRVAVLTT